MRAEEPCVSLLSPAKDLYRRLDQLLGELHHRSRGQEFLVQSLYALFDAFGVELAASGAQLFAHAGPLLERIARSGRLDAGGSSPLALADFRGRLEPAAHRVHLIQAGDETAPMAFFEVEHPERPYVFLFSFEQSWNRETAELVLSTACSILSVRLLEER